MTQQSQHENQDGATEFPVFTEFAIQVKMPDGQRADASASLVDILNAIRPANATVGHAIGILLQYCDAPLEAEPIGLVIELLQASLGKPSTDQQPLHMSPEAARQDEFEMLPEDDRLYVTLVRCGVWGIEPLNKSITHSEYAVVWQGVSKPFESLPQWQAHFTEDDLCVCENTWKGDREWAAQMAGKVAARLNESRALPPEVQALSARLKKKPHLLKFIEWENCHVAGDVAGGCTQSDLAGVSCTKEGGGTEEANRGAYPVNDPHSGRISANDY